MNQVDQRQARILYTFWTKAPHTCAPPPSTTSHPLPSKPASVSSSSMLRAVSLALALLVVVGICPKFIFFCASLHTSSCCSRSCSTNNKATNHSNFFTTNWCETIDTIHNQKVPKNPTIGSKVMAMHYVPSYLIQSKEVCFVKI